MPEVTVEFPEAHSKKQKLIMNAFSIPTIKKVFIACGTKYGKSLSASVCLAKPALSRPKTKWRWIAPYYDQAQIGMDYFKGILPPEPHTKFHRGRMVCEFPKISSEIQFWHAQKPEALEGGGIYGNIMDEAAKCSFEAVASARTTA